MSISTRIHRMAQHHLRRTGEVELNLIPMIDIMSVMVAFLLVYSADVEVVQNGKGVEVPLSVAPEDAKQSVVVMITKDELFVQGERVASVNEIRAAEASVVDSLSAVLTRPLLASEATPEALAQREITLIADKSLPYEVVRKVMATCTAASYGKVSLAVLQKEEPIPTGGESV
jgi:biopolymer transport protein ExbD